MSALHLRGDGRRRRDRRGNDHPGPRSQRPGPPGVPPMEETMVGVDEILHDTIHSTTELKNSSMLHSNARFSKERPANRRMEKPGEQNPKSEKAFTNPGSDPIENEAREPQNREGGPEKAGRTREIQRERSQPTAAMFRIRSGAKGSSSLPAHDAWSVPAGVHQCDRPGAGSAYRIGSERGQARTGPRHRARRASMSAFSRGACPPRGWSDDFPLLTSMSRSCLLDSRALAAL